MAVPRATVSRINVTPVKSTRLLHPEKVRVEPWGIAGNREFFLINDEGRLWNGSRQGSLAMLLTSREGDELSFTFPDGAIASAVPEPTGGTVTTDFYGRPVSGRVVPGPWDAPLAAFAGAPLRLIAPELPGAANDIEPLTMASRASVEALAAEGGADDLDARRFRMSFDIDGCGAFEEESWIGSVATVGGAKLRILGRVPRCVVTTQDPQTGQRDFPTLSVIKRVRGVVDGDLFFGVYAEVVEPGEVSVADSVEIA